MQLYARNCYYCNKDRSDKIYIIDVYREYRNAQYEYTVKAYWGGRAASSYIESIKGRQLSHREAFNLVDTIANEKTHKGYVGYARTYYLFVNFKVYCASEGIPWNNGESITSTTQEYVEDATPFKEPDKSKAEVHIGKTKKAKSTENNTNQSQPYKPPLRKIRL